MARILKSGEFEITSERWLYALSGWSNNTKNMTDVLSKLKAEVDARYFVAGAEGDMDVIADIDNLRNRIENAQREIERGLGRIEVSIEEVDEGLAAMWW